MQVYALNGMQQKAITKNSLSQSRYILKYDGANLTEELRSKYNCTINGAHHQWCVNSNRMTENKPRTSVKQDLIRSFLARSPRHDGEINGAQG